MRVSKGSGRKKEKAGCDHRVRSAAEKKSQLPFCFAHDNDLPDDLRKKVLFCFLSGRGGVRADKFNVA